MRRRSATGLGTIETIRKWYRAEGLGRMCRFSARHG
jgi:hypothetical protein